MADYMNVMILPLDWQRPHSLQRARQARTFDLSSASQLLRLFKGTHEHSTDYSRVVKLMCAVKKAPKLSLYSPQVIKKQKMLIYLLLLLAAVQGTILPARMLQDLDRRANGTLEKYEHTEQDIIRSGSQLSKGSPAWYLAASHETSAEAEGLSRQALRVETMALMVVEALHMSPKDAVAQLPAMNLSPKFCAETLARQNAADCKKSKGTYRTATGRCNNVLHPTWGASLEAYARIIPPEYQDGVSLPRTRLPSAREVSVGVQFDENDSKHPYLMALTALFGQFVAHDLAHTPRMVLPGGERLRCCDIDYENFHPECFPIRADNSIGCMEYSRSAPHPGSVNQGCKLGPRQQMNQATSFLDLSPIYGSSNEVSNTLRTFRSGLLNTQHKNLPMPAKDFHSCRGTTNLPCFFSGDSRINEHPGIALMHVLFLREHNRLAEQLAKLNPHWDDEKLYQETRRLVIAEVQHIVYNEFLPVLFGESNLERFNLRLMKSAFFTGYDSRVDATLTNAAASAGFVFIATLMPKTIDLVDARSSFKFGERSLLSAFYAPQELYEAGAVERLIVGATAGHARKPLGLNEILLQRYFHDGKSSEDAVDYAAQVIQQGRDHGLPSYVHWRVVCDLPDVRNFRDLETTMSKDIINKLQKIYRNVEDIDLVTGALSENPAEDAVMGPTFLCLLGRTFRNARLGDRYWYENEKTPGAFTSWQLAEIRQATMAKILCDNADRLPSVQPRAFLLKDPFLNNPMECQSYQAEGMNLTVWKERRPRIFT